MVVFFYIIKKEILLKKNTFSTYRFLCEILNMDLYVSKHLIVLDTKFKRFVKNYAFTHDLLGTCQIERYRSQNLGRRYRKQE